MMRKSRQVHFFGKTRMYKKTWNLLTLSVFDKSSVELKNVSPTWSGYLALEVGGPETLTQ